jgi:hypothetical protein
MAADHLTIAALHLSLARCSPFLTPLKTNKSEDGSDAACWNRLEFDGSLPRRVLLVRSQIEDRRRELASQ